MSKFLITISILGSVVFIILLVMSFTSRSIESPTYKVLKTIEDVEIRFYPSMLVAKTSLPENSFDNQGSNGFRTVASYIFGGNDKNQKIAMTSPVVMNLGDSATMYFVMPKQYGIDELPRPSSEKVKIVSESAKNLAVISFGGYSNDSKINSKIKSLKETLIKNNIQMKGDFMYMGYNAPWDILNRKNEVAIEVVFE